MVVECMIDVGFHSNFGTLDSTVTPKCLPFNFPKCLLVSVSYSESLYNTLAYFSPVGRLQ